MATRSDFSDKEFGEYLCRQYDAAADAGHPVNRDVNNWRAAAAGAPVGSANDSATVKGYETAMDSARPWAIANPIVRDALDSVVGRGRSASDELALAEAAVRRAAPSDAEGALWEVRHYHATAQRKRGPRVEIAGLDRLRK